MHSIAQVYFGSLWRIEKDQEEEAATVLSNALEAEDGADINDLMDTLEEKFSAHVSYHNDGTKTIVFGRQVTSLTESDNGFDEMSLLRIMDLDNGVLSKDIREEVTKTLEAVPYDLRTNLSSPGFCVAWSTS